MHVVKTRNAHQGLPEVLRLLKEVGVERPSRNGPVLMVPEPVTIQYMKPRERVLYWPERDANPTFHLLESLWMIAGRHDVAFPASIVKSMANFSDDGITFNGAYGQRWRSHFGCDQLLTIADALVKNPDCRRQVLAMWDSHRDLGLKSKDLPCNTHIYFSITADNKLNMTVCNRSNDAVWGALGANVVHMSFLQEVMAFLTETEVGHYWQMSNNLHLYLDNHRELMETMAGYAWPNSEFTTTDPYNLGLVEPASLGNVDEMMKELDDFLGNGPSISIRSGFLRKVAGPLYQAYALYKASKDNDRYVRAIKTVERCAASDWRLATIEWYQRRAKKAGVKV